MTNLFLKSGTLAPKQSVLLMVDVSEQAQRMSKQDLVNYVQKKDDGFLERAMSMVAAGLDREFIKRTLENDIFERRSRHDLVIHKVSSMGSFASMFGMAGTVIGVVSVLRDVSDMDNIVSGLSLALLTTLYGLFFSTVIFLPLASKLQGKSKREMLSKLILMEGVLSIYDKEIPLKVERYLKSFLDSRIYKDAKKK